MSDHRQAPDLLDELLSIDEPFSADEPSSADEDETAAQREAAADEPRPRRRRWWRSKRSADLPDASDAEEGRDSSEESAEPTVAAEPVVAREPGAAAGPVVEPVAAEPGQVEGSPGQQEPPANAAEEPEEEGAEVPSGEIAETPAPRLRGGRHLRGAGDETGRAVDDTAGGSSEPSRSRRGDPVLPPTLGPRRAARSRRRSRIRLIVGVCGALLVLAAAATLAPSLRDDPQPTSTGSAAPVDALADPVRTLLLYGTSEAQASEAGWITLLSLNSETRESSVIYVPAHTATEVPGRGLLGIGESLGTGPSLLEVSTETLLGVPVDARLQLTPEGALALFQGVGEVSVDVPSELRVEVGEGAQLLIPQGPQQLAPDELVWLLFRPGIEGDDAELGVRHLAFWNGALNQYADDPEVLASAVADAEPRLGTTASTERIGAFLSDLAQLPAASRTLANLPVKEVSVGADELYETDPEELSAFVEETVGETDLTTDLSRVQVLNGNGVPGVGVGVAEKLVGEGYQITLSGNADRLDYEWTRIVSYDSSPEGLAAARRARALLGTGMVQVSSQGQGIVDLTIVVGRDFLRTR